MPRLYVPKIVEQSDISKRLINTFVDLVSAMFFQKCSKRLLG